jgi:PAS domain S-box-containing protein
VVRVELVRQLLVRIVVVRRLGVRRRDPVVAFTVGLFVVAGAIGGLSLHFYGMDSTGAWWAVAPFALLLGAAEYLLVRFVYRGEIDALNLFEAALAPALVALSGPLVMLTVAVAQVGAAVVRRNPPRKTLFNVAQWMVAAGAGSVVFAALHHRSSGGDRQGLIGVDIVALVCALLVVSLCNQVAFANVMRLVNGETWRTTFVGLRPVILPGWVGGWVVNTGFGGLFAISYTTSAWALPFFVVPLFMLHWASRGFATARTDRIRLGCLQRATHALAEPIDPRDGIPGFLDQVLAGFEAEAVELRMSTAAVHRAPAGPSRALDDDCIEVPVAAGERVLGSLRVYGRGGAEGFGDGELAVLQALAAEAAGALHKAELLDSILEERRKLFTVVDNTSDGILAVDAAGVIQTWNPGLEAITGYSAATMIGSALVGVLRARDARGNDVLLERWPEADDLPVDVQVLAVDGSTRWLSCSYSRVPPKDDRPGVLVVMARDVTRIHEVERLKEDFVATVSHELRTPLTPIKGFANLLLDGGDRLDEEARRTAAESILRSAQRLERLIVNLLEASRVESHVVDVRDAVVPVRPVVDQVVHEFRTAYPTRCIAVLGDSTATAKGSELWLEQIVSNLLSNAVKYTPEAMPVEVRVHGNGDTVDVAVVDHGPGVPAHEARRIFDRFERLDQDHRQAGTGLGLYIARELAHAMQGTLDVSTGVDGGAVFRLRLRSASAVVVPAPLGR